MVRNLKILFPNPLDLKNQIRKPEKSAKHDSRCSKPAEPDSITTRVLTGGNTASVHFTTDPIQTPLTNSFLQMIYGDPRHLLLNTYNSSYDITHSSYDRTTFSNSSGADDGTSQSGGANPTVCSTFRLNGCNQEKCNPWRGSTMWRSIRLDGTAHAIVTKTVHNNLSKTGHCAIPDNGRSSIFFPLML